MALADEAWFGEMLGYVERRYAGQSDKIGRPYYQHFERVARRLLQDRPHATKAQVQAALLHDALEPGGMSEDELRRIGAEEDAILILRRITLPTDGRPYLQYVADLVASDNVRAIEVKLADNADAIDLYSHHPELAGAELLEPRFRPSRTMMLDALAKSAAAESVPDDAAKPASLSS